MPPTAPQSDGVPGRESQTTAGGFRSQIVETVRQSGGVLDLPAGRLCLPEVFGLCRGVIRALELLQKTVSSRPQGRLFLLGQIIHNPWVNAYFERRDVHVLGPDELGDLAGIISSDDVAIIPAFGVPLPIERQIDTIGCDVVDTTCGHVRRLWKWVEGAANDGYGVIIFGRATHDETVGTLSRLDAVGGKYVVTSGLNDVGRLCDLIVADADASAFQEAFQRPATNAASLAPFARLAQASQTTMLFSETQAVRQELREAFQRRHGPSGLDRLRFEPTVCRATQDRQAAAETLCRGDVDLVVVVGGYGSSNTRHLFELSRAHVPAWFIEDASFIESPKRIRALDAESNAPAIFENWLPERRPLTIGVLAGASSPDVVVGEVLERLAGLLS